MGPEALSLHLRYRKLSGPALALITGSEKPLPGAAVLFEGSWPLAGPE